MLWPAYLTLHPLMWRGHSCRGDILTLQRQYAEAADEFRQYLALAPEAADAPAVRQELADMEKLAVATTPMPR